MRHGLPEFPTPFGNRPGKQDPENRPLSGSAADQNMPHVLTDDAEHGGKAEAGTLARLPCREEGFEYPGTCLLVHPATVIPDEELVEITLELFRALFRGGVVPASRNTGAYDNAAPG